MCAKSTDQRQRKGINAKERMRARKKKRKNENESIYQKRSARARRKSAKRVLKKAFFLSHGGGWENAFGM